MNDLLQALPRPQGVLAWLRAGNGMVAWGKAAQVELRGPDRFDRADEWWRDFVAQANVEDEVDAPGSGPIAFVSMAFADDPDASVMIVPQVLLGKRDGREWVTTIGSSSAEPPAQPVRAPSHVRYADGHMPVLAFHRAVQSAISIMRDGLLEKVVLAHDLIATADEPVDQRFVLKHLADRYPLCWTYAVDGLIGASPELLLRRDGQAVRSRVLAGTTWPGGGTSADELAAALMSSDKDLREHRHAIDSLSQSLRPFCASMSIDGPVVLRLPNVFHLCSEVTGTLRDTPSLLRLAAAVHPTAAVGGVPSSAAMSLLSRLERSGRGRYAGPVGWVDASGDGELAIALRCAQISGSSARLFAGCGLVADSDPGREVQEASAKMRPVRDAIEGI